jgi:hypothetical protein
MFHLRKHSDHCDLNGHVLACYGHTREELVLTHNRNKALVKVCGVQTNHVHVNAAMHQQMDNIPDS